MTTVEPLARVIRRTRNLLLDFDGPICSIFAGYPAPAVASQLRELIRRGGREAPPDIAHEPDPLRLLRRMAESTDPGFAQVLARALRQAELAAVESAAPTPGAADVLHAAKVSGRRVAVVSNNSREAVAAYLAINRLSDLIFAVAGRYDGMDPSWLKPHRHLVDLALTDSETAGSSAALVGDSRSDIEAARAAGVVAIGLANKPRKRHELGMAGAAMVLDDMFELANAITYVQSATRGRGDDGRWPGCPTV